MCTSRSESLDTDRRRVSGPVVLVCAGLVVAVGCTAEADVRPGDVRTYRVPRPAQPVAEARAPREAAGSSLRYEVPPGWEDKGGTGLRLATLAIPSAGPSEVTVIPASGSLESNVARWVGQLDEAADEATRDERAAAAIAAAETVDVDGVKASVVLLLDAAAAAESDGGQAILGAMIPVDGASALFVKYKGDAAIARRERDNFTRFVASIRWK